VAQTFFMAEEVRGATALDAIVTVVDALHFPLQIRERPEAEDQIAFADVVLINKSDLVPREALAAVERAVRAINPYAELHCTRRRRFAEDPDRGVDLRRTLEHDPGFLTVRRITLTTTSSAGPIARTTSRRRIILLHDRTVQSVSLHVMRSMATGSS
jgi:G3E family GTPase